MSRKKKQRKDKQDRSSETIKNIKADIFAILLLLGIVSFLMGIYYWAMAHIALVLTIIGSIIFMTLMTLSIIYFDFIRHTFSHILNWFDYYAEIKQSYQDREKQDKEQLETQDRNRHPLNGHDIILLKLYIQGLSFMFPNFQQVFERDSFHALAEDLGIPSADFSEIQQETYRYDEIAKQATFDQLHISSDAISKSCFFCDFTWLFLENSHGGNYSECWKNMCKTFHLNMNDSKHLELLCKRMVSGENRMLDDDFGEIPQSVINYYLPCDHDSLEDSGEYLVIDLSEGANAINYPVRYTNEAPLKDSTVCRMSELWLRRIPAGSFSMGSPPHELGHRDDESLHTMTLFEDFYIGVFPVTQRQWELVMGKNPSTCLSSGPCSPVEYVSYDDIRGKTHACLWDSHVSSDSFMGLLCNKTDIKGFDLPTETQWEYACRASTESALNINKNLTNSQNCIILDTVAWYRHNANGATHPVGEKQPNRWGLYDMHGNILEWCRDSSPIYSEAGSPNLSETSYYAPRRICRGGSWRNRAEECRSACRYSFSSNTRHSYIGFRLSLTLTNKI